MTPYLRLRDGHYYFRLRVPADLLGTIKEKEIHKSLRTKDRKSARLAASCLLPSVLEVFTLTRTGILSQSQATERLDNLLKRTKKRPTLDSPTVQPTRNDPSSPLLGQAIKEYISDKKSGWTAKTLLEYNSYFRLALDITGNIPVADINRDTVRHLRDTLTRLPGNVYKKYPGMNLSQVLEMKDISPMCTSTVNKLLTLFGSITLHCVKEGYRKDNPVEGLKIKQKKRTDEERKAYSPDDLKKIIVSLPPPEKRPERYWIPLIGMYSGMRLGEICGLHVEDIRLVDGIWCFDVNEDQDKRLKNLSSKRVIPIHPRLVELGFLAFVDKLRKCNCEKRLWPNLNRRESDGYCSSIGHWYQRFNRKHVTADPLKTFHSLRHTFADTLKQMGTQETIICELMGHTNDSITTGRYGKRYRPKILLEAVRRLHL